MDDALSETQEEHDIVDLAFAPRLLNFAARIVQKHEIEIRAVAELQAAELAVTSHGDLHDASVRVAVAAVRYPVDLRHLSPSEIHAALNDEFGNVGEPVADRHQRQASGEVRERHRKYRDLLELPQSLDLPFRIIGGQPLGARGQFTGKTCARGDLIEGFGVDQLVEQQGKIGDLTRQEAAYAAAVDQTIERRRLFLQQREI